MFLGGKADAHARCFYSSLQILLEFGFSANERCKSKSLFGLTPLMLLSSFIEKEGNTNPSEGDISEFALLLLSHGGRFIPLLRDENKLSHVNPIADEDDDDIDDHEVSERLEQRHKEVRNKNSENNC